MATKEQPNPSTPKQAPGIYIDGGYHRGGGHQEMMDRGIIGDDWVKIGFEPNPMIYDLPDWVKRGALGDEDGVTEFYPQDPDEGDFSEMGSTMLPAFRDALDHHANKTGAEKRFDPAKAAKVPVFRLADVLKDARTLYDAPRLVLKLDVEGMEYRIVRDLLRTGAAKLIDDAFIEWHHWAKFGPTSANTKRLKQRLKRCGVKVHYHG